MLRKQVAILDTPIKISKPSHKVIERVFSVFNRPAISSVNPDYSSSPERGGSNLWQLASVGQDNRDELAKIDRTPNERLHLSSFIHCGKITVVTPLSTLPS
jgi:hypothetical protein